MKRLIGLAVVGLALAGCGSDGVSGHDAKLRSECKSLAQMQVRHPAEAKWDKEITVSDVTSMDLESGDIKEGQSAYRVYGKVTAPNSFGVKDRLRFNCTAVLIGGAPNVTLNFVE